MLDVGDSRPETMPWVGGDAGDPALVGVEPDGKGAEVVDPEVFVESLLEGLGLGPTSIGSAVIAERVGQFRSANERAVDIRLHLAQGDRSLGDRSITVTDPVPGVLPALILEA